MFAFLRGESIIVEIQKLRRYGMKKWTMSWLLLLFTFLLVACGGKEAAEGEKKDTLVYAQISEGKTLDPQDTTEQYSQRSRLEEHTSELQSRQYLVCRLLLEKKK